MPVVQIQEVPIALVPRSASPRAVLRMAEAITLPVAGAQPFRIEVALTFAPVNVRHSQLSAAFAQIDRPGRAPLSVWSNPQLEQITFQAILVNDFAPGYADCEEKIALLKAMALLPTDVVFAYGNVGSGKRFKMTEFSFESNMRHPETDRILRGTADITLTESIQTSTGIVAGLQRLADIPRAGAGAGGGSGATSGSQRDASVNDPYNADAAARRILGIENF